MEGLKSLEKLASAARRNPPPRIDVTDRVLRSLRTREEDAESPLNTPLLGFSAVSFASALIVAVLALQSWLSVHDPMVALVMR